ncbi:MAG: hypothetical protein K6T73_08205, partial [Candidatus Bathyarchaeota archaeon]|nr:hypothetical protein [Candidatus Bathyarchaeota archaeon]
MSLSETIPTIIQQILEAQKARESELKPPVENITDFVRKNIELQTIIYKPTGASLDELIKNAGKTPSKLDDMIARLLEAAKVKTESYNPTKPPTPEEVYSEKAKWAEYVSGKVNEALTSGNWLSMIPFLNLGQWATSYLSNPGTRANIEVATGFHLAPWNFGQQPLLQRRYYKLYLPLVPEPYRLADMRAKQVITDNVYKDYMKQNGLAENWADSWADAQRAYPVFQQLIELLRRGIITTDTFLFWMGRNGYYKAEAETLMKLKDVIPPISDLIR